MTDDSRKMRLFTRSLWLSASLAAAKAAAGLAGNSLALMASAADSLMDLFLSAGNYVLARSAAKPADPGHPYGHGKIESLGGVLQALVMAGVSLAVGVGAVRRLLAPEPLERTWLGVAVMAAAAGANLWHSRNLLRSAGETHSPILSAEYVHYASDTLAHAGVIAALILFRYTGQTFWDPLVSLVIVGYLLWGVVRILRQSVGELLDSSLPEEVAADIQARIRAHDPRVLDFHDFRGRRSGGNLFLEFHLELRGDLSFRDAHELTESLVDEIQARYPGCVVTVHADPEGGR
jgi:ferrous-iron efflux pump FieF